MENLGAQLSGCHVRGILHFGSPSSGRGILVTSQRKNQKTALPGSRESSGGWDLPVTPATLGASYFHAMRRDLAGVDRLGELRCAALERQWASIKNWIPLPTGG